MQEIYLKHLQRFFHRPEKAIPTRLQLEAFLRLKKRIEIDCYHVDYIPEAFAKAMYGDLVEQFSYHDITTYISIDGRDAVKATFQKVLDQACADKGVEIIKKPWA